MELKDLCGKHVFSGCQLCTEKNTDKYAFYDSCNVCLFTLDGITYKAIEDPDDGWRSYCSSIEISNVKPKYSFEGIEVDCSMKPDDINGHHDILVIKDAITENVVLEVGTRNIGDWYPYCHFSYHPENMVCNQISETRKIKVSSDDFLKYDSTFIVSNGDGTYIVKHTLIDNEGKEIIVRYPKVSIEFANLLNVDDGVLKCPKVFPFGKCEVFPDDDGNMFTVHICGKGD